MQIKDFFQKKAWRKWDKSQWAILILAGVLLMILAIPAETKKTEAKGAGEDQERPEEAAEDKEDYAKSLEARLKNTLSKIDGAGRVEVMVTLEDFGESVVEKDLVQEASNLSETDTAGGSRFQKDEQTSYQAVYQEEDRQKAPFIGREMTPKVAGVLIVAEGGENTAVKQNISDAVMALFQIEVNRIKVVKMNIQEAEY